jgi:soluble lytic murein transglycosylase-like protein
MAPNQKRNVEGAYRTMQHSKIGKIGILASILLLINLSVNADNQIKAEIIEAEKAILYLLEKVPGHTINKKHKLRAEIATAFILVSRDIGLDSDLLIATGFHESTFLPTAVSKRGAFGIMQVMLCYNRVISVKDYNWKKPHDQILAGAKLLKFYIKDCGTLQKGMESYITGKCDNAKFIQKKAKERIELSLWLKDRRSIDLSGDEDIINENR